MKYQNESMVYILIAGKAVFHCDNSNIILQCLSYFYKILIHIFIKY